jgi:hypothetical protein
MEERKRGRPSKGSAAKRAPLNLKTTPELRDRIRDAAKGRALTQEIEDRLRASFLLDDIMGGSHIRSFVMALGQTIGNIERRTGAKWLDDPATWTAVTAATLRLLRWDKPDPSPEEEARNQAEEDHKKAVAVREDAERALNEFRAAHGIKSAEAYQSEIGTMYAHLAALGSELVRNRWTADELAEEIRLMEALIIARDAEYAAFARLTALSEPIRQMRHQAAEMGRAEAEPAMLNEGG